MGIRANDVPLLFYSKNLGVSFTKTLTLGRMNFLGSKNDILRTLSKNAVQANGVDELEFRDGYSEPFFKLLGAEKIDSMDNSDYEKATILHDLNTPLPSHLRQSYTVVVDGGTLEHVFNFPEAIRSSMMALETGGHYIGITPANNYMGHGFYQFSPELYFRIFSDENGFRVKKMLLSLGSELDDMIWYEVADPKEVRSRVSLVNNVPVLLVIIAEKTAEKPIFATSPQQSDYAAAWSEHKASVSGDPLPAGKRVLNIYRKLTPKRVKIVLHNIYDLFTKEKATEPGLGEFKAGHFVPVEL
jgi:hypothetical protein